MKATWLFLAVPIALIAIKEPVFYVKELAGKAYLVNQYTGQLSLIKGDKEIKLQTKPPTNKHKPLDLYGSFAKKLKFHATTKLIGNKVYYQLFLEGFESKITDSSGNVTTNKVDFEWFEKAVKSNEFDMILLQFVDEDGFTLEEKEIRLSKDYTSTFDTTDTNSKLVGFSYEGSFPVDPLVLSETTKLNFRYRLSSLNQAPQK